MRRAAAAAVAVGALSLAACTESTPGSRAPAPAPATAPASGATEEAKSTPKTSDVRADGVVAPASPAQPPPPSAPPPTEQAPPVVAAPPRGGQPAPSEAKASMVSVARARGELEIALRSLDGRPGTCASACRALASMERATAHLCETARESDETRACEDAKRTLKAADTRVRSSCGTCR